MSLLNYFGWQKKSADKAKDRLRIIIAQQRGETSSHDYLPMLKREILEVIAKYTKVDLGAIDINLQQKDHNAVLELNVVLPESEEAIQS